jgi:hypothetical protein
MSSLARLSLIEGKLREVIGSGCYSDAQELLTSYVGLAERLTAELPAPEIEQLASRTKAFLEWAVRTLRCRRAFLSMQHYNVSRISAYTRRSCRPASRLSMDA